MNPTSQNAAYRNKLDQADLLQRWHLHELCNNSRAAFEFLLGEPLLWEHLQGNLTPERSQELCKQIEALLVYLRRHAPQAATALDTRSYLLESTQTDLPVTPSPAASSPPRSTMIARDRTPAPRPIVPIPAPIPVDPRVEARPAVEPWEAPIADVPVEPSTPTTLKLASQASPEPEVREPAKKIRCPMCLKQTLSETLEGGRVRCEHCHVIFFPEGAVRPDKSKAKADPVKAAMGMARSAKAAKEQKEQEEGAKQPAFSTPQVKPSAPKKTPARPASKVGAPGEKPRWKQPGPLAGMAAAVLLLGYLYFPSDLFGRGDRQSVHPVQGTITYEGKPIPNAALVLHPRGVENPDFPRPKAKVGPNGSFVVGTYGPDDGAPVGEYVVTVQWYTAPSKNEDAPPPRNLLPVKFSQIAQSGLIVRIQEGDNKLPPLTLTR